MSGYLRDGEGNKSSKRLMQFIVVIAAVMIALVAVVIAVVDGEDIGSNIMYLVTGMITISLGAGAAVAFSNKNEKS